MEVDFAELDDALFAPADDLLVGNVTGIEDVEPMAGRFAAPKNLIQRLAQFPRLHRERRG